MMHKWIVTGTGLLLVALGVGAGAGTLRAAQQAAPPADAAAAKPAYTLPEYNQYKAADAEQNPQMKIKMLDDFVKAYPMSSLLPYVYRDYYLTNYALKNFTAVTEYADRMLALGDKVDTQGRLEALVARAQGFYVGQSDKALQTPEAMNKARDAANMGLKTLEEWKKPDAVTADQFEMQKKGMRVQFDTILAVTSTSLKDYPAAVAAYKAILAADPNDSGSHFRLGVVYLQMMPPQGNDGFWELSRAIALKIPNAAQVQTYMKGQLTRYQQTSCDKLIDDQLSELVTLAGSSAERPATLNIPSAADLDKARNDVANFIPALQMGGAAGKVMWLATCGLEYPDVAVKVMEAPVATGDSVTFKGFRPSSQDPDAAQKEFDAATTANMQITVVGQPDAKRIEKDSPVRFTGTLTAYSQNPFLLTWDKAKINMEDIPDEKAAPGAKKPAVRRPAAAPKAPVKKAPGA